MESREWKLHLNAHYVTLEPLLLLFSPASSLYRGEGQIPQLSSDITFLKDEIQQFIGNNLPRSLRFKNITQKHKGKLTCL